jgi:tRNA A37 threonylcarbamoyladenosine dehydratase
MDELSRLLSGRRPSIEERASFRPLRYNPADPEDRSRLAALIESGSVHHIHDSIVEQVGELIEIETPERKWPAPDLERAARDRLAAAGADRYGTWIFYPWLRSLVHVLPEAEFRSVRTSRNRNKITIAEQDLLRRLRIGVLGLSVGQATAVVLAMEEVGGELVLADFDRLSLSNMNRLRAGVHDIGTEKTVLTARQIFELNPYASVTTFPEGLNDGNIAHFLDSPRPLDLLIEECDDLFMKVRVRELARSRGIPVLMETSDRGMLDIERFDREPQRPLLHGVTGELSAERLRGLTAYEKVPVILGLLGDGISPRLAASLVEVESSLKTWPQLASAVALGSGVCVDAVRRVALGQLTQSGRFYVDPATMVADGLAHPTAPPAPAGVAAEARQPLAVPPLSPASKVGREEIRALVAYASLAPSGGNCQPWRFRWDGQSLHCLVDQQRAVFDANASYLAVGAAIENVVLAAERLGMLAEISAFPQGPGDLVATVRFQPGFTGEPDPLFSQIPLRVTNRHDGTRQPIPPADIQALTRSARARDGDLRVVTSAAELDAIGRVLAVGDRLRYLCQSLHHELVREIRWSPEEVVRTRDGVDIETLELSPTDRAGMKLTSDWKVMRLVGELGGGRALEKASRKSIAGASAVGLLTTPGDTPLSFLTAGRATQRIWLEATARGYAFQPVTAVTYVFASVDREDPKGLDAPALEELREIRQLFRGVFPTPPGWSEPMLFRLARAQPPTARALRRPVDQILSFDD